MSAKSAYMDERDELTALTKFVEDQFVKRMARAASFCGEAAFTDNRSYEESLRLVRDELNAAERSLKALRDYEARYDELVKS